MLEAAPTGRRAHPAAGLRARASGRPAPAAPAPAPPPTPRWRRGRDRTGTVAVDVPGGRLSVRFAEGTTVLTGPAVLVAAGVLCGSGSPATLTARAVGSSSVGASPASSVGASGRRRDPLAGAGVPLAAVLVGSAAEEVARRVEALRVAARVVEFARSSPSGWRRCHSSAPRVGACRRPTRTGRRHAWSRRRRPPWGCTRTGEMLYPVMTTQVPQSRGVPRWSR